MLNLKDFINPYVQIKLPREAAERIHKLMYFINPSVQINPERTK